MATSYLLLRCDHGRLAAGELPADVVPRPGTDAAQLHCHGSAVDAVRALLPLLRLDQLDALRQHVIPREMRGRTAADREAEYAAYCRG